MPFALQTLDLGLFSKCKRSTEKAMQVRKISIQFFYFGTIITTALFQNNTVMAINDRLA